MTTVLDGPMGTQLAERGVQLTAPAWSAGAIDPFPDVIADIHRAYAAAGATVHTAATFRTTHRAAGSEWRRLARVAVAIARASVPGHHRVAGSIAPLEDCYRPDLSPPEPDREHRALAEALAEHGVDLLLCETFPHVAEGLSAALAACATGLPTWLSFSAGPAGHLLSPDAMADGARRAADLGVEVVLVNCVDAQRIHPFVAALAASGVPFGVYANAGPVHGGLGWGANGDAAARYAAIATRWLDLGACVVGGCCGTAPEHVVALTALVNGRAQRATKT